jgi:hypothetical protein
MSNPDQQAVQRQTEAIARDALRRALAELGCPQPALAEKRLWQIVVGHFELRARRRGPEFCPNHPGTRNPCGLCVLLGDRPDDEENDGA